MVAPPSPLLAVLLVTSSSRGTSITFQYPRRPKLEKRYSQVRYHVADDERQGAQNRVQEDEMEDEFESEIDLSDDEDETEDSDSDASDMLDADEERSEIDAAALNRREADGTSSTGGNGAGAKEAAGAALQRVRRLKAYQQYLGYDTEILASILAPRRELCHRKFELVIDDLAFVGHPVCVDKDGYWDKDEQQRAARGRGPKRKDVTTGYLIDDEPLQGGGLPTELPQTRVQAQAPLTMFHFVLVLDRPDPSPHLPLLDLTSWLQMFYDNVAFKTTAALFAEEVQYEYITRESEKLGLLRDRCMDDAQSYSTFLTQQLNYSSLARSLECIYTSLLESCNAFVTINDHIDVHLQLPPILHDPARMMQIADVETPIDANDPIYTRDPAVGPISIDDLIFEEWTRTTGPFLLPWKSLLLLNEDGESREAEDGSLADLASEQRVHLWAKKFTSLLQPTMEGVPTFAEIADLLDWDLEDDVYPMARHLIYYREARVVDVPRIQNYYAISPLFDLADLPRLSTSWSIRFPTSPALAAFLATLSSGLRPFSKQCGREQRRLCMDILIWLLRHQVVVQMHVRLRLIANEEAKRQAAAHRRGERIRIKDSRERRMKKEQERDARQRAAAAAAARKIEPSSPPLSRSAPAQVREIAADSISTTRGRSRERSQSPASRATQRFGDEEPQQVLPVAVPSFASALSATRPDLSDTASPRVASPLAPSSFPAVMKLAEQVDELKFERRPVLRSRSPSRMLALATGTSFGTRASGSPRPSTPRGRGRNAGLSRERSRAQSNDVEQRQPNTVPITAAKSRSHRSVTREGRSSSSASRSPSRALIRVTGFGEGEEIYVDRSGASEEAPAMTTEENHRRLTRVGEEVEADAAAAVAVAALVNNSLESGDGEDSMESEEYNEDLDEIEFEAWETKPQASIIPEPSRAGGEEIEWIAAIVENRRLAALREGRQPGLEERLFELLPFLNGKHTIDEIVYRLDWRRKDLRAVLVEFNDDILTLVHP